MQQFDKPYIKQQIDKSRFCIQIDWDDVPHLKEEEKKKLWDSIPVHQRDARSKGIPVLGSGQIYPVAEESLLVDPFDIPEFWPRVYGLDVGWNRTAAIWGAYDKHNKTWYLYSEHYQGHQPPSIHADAIRARDEWIPGVIDPAAGAANQKDGSRLLDEYIDLGLDLYKADNTVEAGLLSVYRLMVSGRLKVFSTLRNWRSEFRIYRRDEKGKIIKENDHLMDATRYLIQTGQTVMTTAPAEEIDPEYYQSGFTRSDHTGY